jgi:GNAT superfamily N-acetyltransferase
MYHCGYNSPLLRAEYVSIRFSRGRVEHSLLCSNFAAALKIQLRGPDMTELRRAAAGDVVTLLPLVAEYWRFENISGFDAERVSAQLTRLLTTPSLGAGWVAVAEGNAVGYLLAVYVFSLEHLGLTAEVDEFYVAPSRRGQGIGAKLLALAETEFVRVGCTNASLQLSRGNDAGREFYRRYAYRERAGYELLDKTLPAP